MLSYGNGTLKVYPIQKFVFEKTKFKVLHSIQHGFIRQSPDLSKGQASMFKTLVIH